MPCWARLAALAVLASNPAAAALFSKSSGARGPALLIAGMGARPAGMADAFVGVADDTCALYWNPAGLGRIPTREALFQHRESFGGITHDAAAFVQPVWWKGSRRTWGLSISYLAGKSFDVVEFGGAVGAARPWDAALGLSYSQALGDVDMGSTIKIVRQEIFGQSAQAYAVDLGFLGLALNDRLTWGAALTNLGTRLDWGETSQGLPTALRGGASYRFGTSGLMAAGQWDAGLDDSAVGRAGFEYQTSGQDTRAALRFGYRTGGDGQSLEGFSMGGGIAWKAFRFDYAFVPRSGLDDEHHMGLTLRWGAPLPPEQRQGQLMKQAQAEAADGRLIKAQETVAEVLKESPSYAPANELARRIRERVSESTDPETLFVQGHASYQGKKWEAAADFLRRLLVIKPNHKEGRDLLKKAETEMAAQREASIRESVARAQRRDAAAARERATAHMTAGQWDKALDNWLRLLELDPHTERAQAAAAECRRNLYELGQKAQAAGDLDQALAYFQAAQKGGAPYKDAAERIQKLTQAARGQRGSEAQRAYTEGMRLYGQGRLEEARDLLRKAQILAPEDVLIRKALESVEQELRHQGNRR